MTTLWFNICCDLNVLVLAGSNSCLSPNLAPPVKSPSPQKRPHLKISTKNNWKCPRGKNIITSTRDLGLEIVNIRGQGFEGAANMSSDNVGVQCCSDVGESNSFEFIVSILVL